MTLHEEHKRRVLAVNEARAEEEHMLASERLIAWREGVEAAGGVLDFLGMDRDMGALYPGRPLCCGVLLDWATTEITATTVPDWWDVSACIDCASWDVLGGNEPCASCMSTATPNEPHPNWSPLP